MSNVNVQITQSDLRSAREEAKRVGVDPALLKGLTTWGDTYGNSRTFEIWQKGHGSPIATNISAWNAYEAKAIYISELVKRHHAQLALANKQHRQNILDRLTDMQNELTRVSSVIHSDTTDGLAIHNLERVSAQAAVLVKVIRDKTEIDNAQPAN